MDVLVDGELHLYGSVGMDMFGDGFSAKDVVSALAQHGRKKDIVVRLNSGGG
jgi:ATP-dependent Clp protease, protease subunit